MAQRFLEVEVSRHIFTTVNIVVDDEDEKFKEAFDGGVLSYQAFRVLQKAAHEAADKIAPEYDWETDKTETDIDGLKEVSKEEAAMFQVWDAQNNRKFGT